MHLMNEIRKKINADCFEGWAKDFLCRYNNE